MEKQFELAIRSKVRFNFRGSLSTEDLWDLGVLELDTIYKTLNAQIKVAQEDSLLEVKSNADKELALKLAIVKYVVAVKLEERKNILEARDKKERKQKLLEVLATKQEEALGNKSEEEIRKLIEELE